MDCTLSPEIQANEMLTDIQRELKENNLRKINAH